MQPEDPAALQQLLGDHLLEHREEHGWLMAWVDPGRWYDSAVALNNELQHDYLFSLTAVDCIPEHFELVAHLLSLSRGRRLALKCRLPRDGASVRSLIEVWSAADWLEREAAEMFGIHFQGHPDLTPLLLPEGWEDQHPLRKDYVEPD